VEKGGADLSQFDLASSLEKLFLYCLCWSMGALLEQEDRVKFHVWIKERDTKKCMPQVGEGETIYEYFVNLKTMAWEQWRPPTWTYPQSEKLDFSNLLVPTMDSTRALFLLQVCRTNLT
jgi:dynein heavy chain